MIEEINEEMDKILKEWPSAIIPFQMLSEKIEEIVVKKALTVK